ncbi:MAG: VTT domain-containing protein [Candidatus Aenigmarchaeota archaeon]|nr:VTT domain-containing protein [Candidatus Aenigmarchaeota archaeon]
MDMKGFWKLIKKEEMKYGNLLLLLVSLIVAYIILTPSLFGSLVEGIKETREYGLLGVFIAGLFFSYGLTTPVSIVVLYAFGSVFNPLSVAAIGAAGAAISDYIIYYFVKRSFSKEFDKGLKKFGKLSKWLHYFAPVIAGLIIASPLPDELGAAFLGIVKFEKRRFFVFAYFANFFGILLLAWLGSAI